MSLETDIRDLLAGDSPLTTLLTGGLYAFTALGRQGFTRKNDRVTAWQTDSGRTILQPALVIKDRGATPTGERWDTPSKAQSQRITVEMWLYDFSEYDQIRLAAERIYQLLHAESLAGIGYVARINTIRGQRDQNLNDAALIRDDYRIKRVISGA